MLFNDLQKLPLEMSELQKVLEYKNKKDYQSPPLSQEVMMEVSYKESTLSGKFFLNYVSNLKLSIVLKNEDIPEDEKFSLLEDYMNSTNMVEIHTLNTVVCSILMEDKGLHVDSVVELWLSKEQRKEFTQKNRELIDKWHHFLESIPVGLPFCSQDYSKTIGRELVENGVVDVITDANAVGKSVALCIGAPNFLELYLSAIPKKDKKAALYETQWFEPVFSGHSLMSILHSTNSSMLAFMVGLFEQWFTEEEIKKFIQSEAA